MTSEQMIILMVIVIIFPEIALAKTFTVGDDKGWTTGFNYQNWAKGKQFQTGDKLVFNYAKGAHYVFKLDGDRFQKCIKPYLTEAMTSGNDVITLSTTGTKWYICGVGIHCAGGQKLTIEVTSNNKAARSRRSKNSSNKLQKSWLQVSVIALVTAGMMLILL